VVVQVTASATTILSFLISLVVYGAVLALPGDAATAILGKEATPDRVASLTLLAPAGYWLTVALIRIGGTAGGDAFAHALHLVPSTVLTGMAFVGLVVWFYRRPTMNQVAQAGR